MEDPSLLKRFVESRSDEAFRNLVARYASMVTGIAARPLIFSSRLAILRTPPHPAFV
ncbi:MAG: hypothetical protein ACJASX_000771 [Limisphaerales bacterium]|jgi:hypothetical protein